MKAWDGCQLWVITAKGHTMVERYLPIAVPYRPLDLARPTTALEHAEYRVQFAVRACVIQLILEARQTAWLAQLRLELPQRGLPRLGGLHGTLPPDALLSIAWHPATVQPATWLPWLHREMDAQPTIHYPVYVDRAMHLDHLPRAIDAWRARATNHQFIPILILQCEQQLTLAQQTLQLRSDQHPVRLSRWGRLEAGVSGVTWLDEQGHACSLQP